MANWLLHFLDHHFTDTQRMYHLPTTLIHWLYFRECPVGTTIVPFIRSECELDPDLFLKLTAPDLCGLYQGAGAGEDIFADCHSIDAAMAALFYDICVYDFCENSLTSDAPTTSGCYIDGGTGVLLHFNR